ncbi:sugar ABC transporter ATP-binding protein (plasmid) [Rhizobium leguminosarum bv. trifolii WSM1689]|uniref:ABC transporter ATP-binding protein n=1 Tax=Rhizobium TaxID=379 RepID=UPI00037B9276|nr:MULTISPECIES: ABC transporter ATP-binding protein [Rhizobium]AHF87475.1 sugar ABC transporter ATP-binding protein [Rhizobium leguminosarum bv. trifolii WSM1689]ASR10235.1 ABC transporter ATP-binding protein [Rhizobium leguminosarum bv. viciae]MBY3197449.1 ABC transporter ATP-binding protein [Rhizobium laguerreae]MBY5634419.1 ABC transporter ATP-binding protein [Rhizobium leguminosarum]MBY5737606.1 ABC transporter ATP-binding protein [Rhizobium leguminosarum]
MANIVIDRIRKSFGAFQALKEVSLTIDDGEFVSLLGPSGCGKTTLLRIIAGLETATSGDVRIGDKSVIGLPPKDRGLAMVFQNYAVFPHMTVYENVAFGLRMQKADDARVKAQVEKAAGLLHIEQYLDRYPNKLSGGQRQRVAVARALAVEPKVLLMDEPLSNLDALLRLEMRTELKTVLQSAGTTTIYVTHDQTEAMGLSDRIAVMHGGVVEQVGHPVEIYNHPATRFVGGFIGNPPMNFIQVPVSNGQVAVGAERLVAPQESGDQIVLGLRGEAVELAPLPQGLEMRVRVAEPMGSHLLLTGSIHDQPVRVILPASETVKSGETIGLKLDQKRITWLSPESGKSFPAVLA